MSYKPKFAIYHANAKCTGSAMMLSLHPMIDNEDKHEDGYIEMTIVPQKTAAIGGKQPTYDVDNGITVQLVFDDVCKILQVLRGEMERIDDGRGLYHADDFGTCRVTMNHMIEPVFGYMIEMCHTNKSDGAITRCKFFLTNAEACGITEALAQSCGMLVFGVPCVIPHN